MFIALSFFLFSFSFFSFLFGIHQISGNAPNVRSRRAAAPPKLGCQRLIFIATHRALISHCEVASVASGLLVVMDTKAWDPRDGELGMNCCPVYRIPVSSGLIDGIDGSFVIL